jgi:CRP-like cAMP-binding protein
MQDGSHFGEMALLNPDRMRTASVVALEISEVYRLDRRDFNSIVAQFPDMVDQLKQIAAERSEQLQRLDVVI